MPDGTKGDSGMPLGAVAKRLGVRQHDDGHAVVGGSTPSAPTKKRLTKKAVISSEARSA